MQVTFTIPNAVATKLNAIGEKYGFPNAKAWTVDWWKGELRRRAVEAAGDTATDIIRQAKRDADAEADSIT